MASRTEERTKGLVSTKLFEIYNTPQDIKKDGVIWFKENSYVSTEYDWLNDVFSRASKSQNESSHGTPDFTVIKENSNAIIVIECKANEANHSCFDEVSEYIKNGYGTPEQTVKYAINGALYYASFLSSKFDVIAIGVSGTDSTQTKVTSFLLPRGSGVKDLRLIEDGRLNTAIKNIQEYEDTIDYLFERVRQEEEITSELRKYALKCANYLRSNGIEDNAKAGFVSAIILGLTNKESQLYKTTKEVIDIKNADKSKIIQTDLLGLNVGDLVKQSLYGKGERFARDYIKGVFDIDNIPDGKRVSLKMFYDGLLGKPELLNTPKGIDKNYFKYGDTVLSCCVYSLYENVTLMLEKFSGIDIMGEFYTTFLRFTKGNAKEKGIVLTPKHITELFCDLAEYYGDCKLTEKTKVIDTCCGSGQFLISALSKIKDNIYSENITETEKQRRYSEAQKNCLIGVEKEPSMYALAYANMRFHGDGKSNLFNCSSLSYDSFVSTDDSGKTYVGDRKVSLDEALKQFGEIDFGFINPPYSLSKNDDGKKKKYPDDAPDEVKIQNGISELDFVISMLHYLKQDGIGIVILPMSCAGNADKVLRSELLKYHTLIASMTMPANLFFDSHVGTATCIMVFRAHKPHDFSKSVFFGRWKDDGFKVIPHNGRRDSGIWNQIKQEWLDQIDGSATADDTIWQRVKIKNGKSEALAEAYIKTDFSKLSDNDFEKTLKKYALFKYMEENGMLEE